MNTNLKKLVKGKSGRTIILNVILALVIVVCVLVLVGESAGKSDSAAGPYTLDSKEGDRAYVDAQYMSEYFAFFESKESDRMYFILDKDFGAYIVCLSDKEAEKYDDLQAYTFGETNVEPEVIRTYGQLVPLDDEIMEMAIEEFNWFWGENVVTEDNFYDIFGEYYIDTAVTDVSGTSYVLIVLIAAAAVLMVVMAKKNKDVRGVAKQTMAELEANGEVDAVNAELKDASTRYFKRIGIYLTENYLISFQNGLVVANLRRLTGIYGVITEKNYALVVRDTAAAEKMVMETKNKVNKQWDELTALVAAISEQVPGLEYGANCMQVEGTVDVTHVEQFFVARKTDSAMEVQHDMSNPDGTIVNVNYGLGIVGALIGALLGGAIWFLVGYVGYIAGIVGFLIIYLSAMGFKKGAKVLTKGGAVFTIVISMLTILAANYALYAWQFAQAYEGRFTFVECLGQLPGWLKTNSEVFGGFIKDICIGYVFTLLAGFSTVKNMFGKKTKK